MQIVKNSSKQRVQQWPLTRVEKRDISIGTARLSVDLSNLTSTVKNHERLVSNDISIIYNAYD